MFMQNKLRNGARIDFYRGAPADDLCNIAWSSWLARLPRYEQLAGAMWSGATERGQEPLSHACVTARGNAMEIAVGLAWAASTGGRYLTEGHAIEWNASPEEWKEVWKHMEARGLAPGSASAKTPGNRFSTPRGVEGGLETYESKRPGTRLCQCRWNLSLRQALLLHLTMKVPRLLTA